MGIAATSATAPIANAAFRPAQSEAARVPSTSRDSEPPLKEVESDLSFWDVLDIVNPLQHIPIVGSIYRAITGDTIAPSSSVIGGILFGGVIGGAFAVANGVIQQTSGKDAGEHVLASLGFDGGGSGESGATRTTAVAAVPGTQTTTLRAEPTLTEKLAAEKSAASLPNQVADLAASTRKAQTATQVAAGGPFAASEGGHRPSRMPARDTMLASSLMAKHAVAPRIDNTPGVTAAALRTARTPVADAPPNGAPPTATPMAAQVQTQMQAQAETQKEAQKKEAWGQAADAFSKPVAPEMISETMMRNLAKYEQSRKAVRSTTPTLSVEG
jgi:hypothetical protein